MEQGRDKDHALSRRLARLITVPPADASAETQVLAAPPLAPNSREAIERQLMATWQMEQDLRRIAAAPPSEPSEDGDDLRIPKNQQRRWHRWRIAQEQKFNEELARRRSLEERELEQARLTAEAQLLEQLDSQRNDATRRLEEWKRIERARFEHEFAQRAVELEARWQQRRAEQETNLAERIRDEEHALQQRVAAVLATLHRAGAQLDVIPAIPAAASSSEALHDDREALRRIAEAMFREQQDDRIVVLHPDQPRDPRVDALERPKVAFLPRAAKG